jgi:hypothetical protein
VRAKDLASQLAAERQQLSSEREQSQMDALGLLCGYVYLQANVKNYGLASQYSTNFFDHVRGMAGQALDTNRQAFLQSALAKRDSITQGLARGDPGVVAAVQDLFQSTLKISQTGSK